jgi:hypothetical protein
MNAQTQIAPANQVNSVGFLNVESFEFSQRVANMLTNSTLVPEQYRAVLKVKAGKDNYGNMQYRDEPNPNGLSNCIVALNMANRMGADPLMIMQNLYLIEGRPSWSSQFIMASINSCGRFSSLRFEVESLGEIEVEYQETTWQNRQKQTTTKTMKVENQTCIAWALEAGTRMPEFTLEELKEYGGVYKCCKAYGIPLIESSKISIEMAVKEGWYTKNGSKWKTMPEQMLRYRAASFFGRVYAPELLMGLRSVEEERDRIIDVTPDQSLSEQADSNQIKREILGAKSPAALDEAESKVLMLSNDSKREELLKLISAQAKKFQPEKVANDQNSTSNDVAETTVSEKKPEPAADEAPPVQEVAEKKQTSTEVRKAMLEQISGMKNVNDLKTIIPFIRGHEILTAAHKTYLINTIEHEIGELTKPAEQPATQAPAVNEIKSKGTANGLKISIESAQTVEALTDIAQTIRDSKPNMTIDHLNDVLNACQLRKKFLEDQQDMFAGVPDLTWTDSAIKQIESAKNQDDINAVYTDPQFEEQSDKDKQRLNLAAQKRESELFG